MASSYRAHYVDALEAFVSWTLDTINPAWRTERRRGRERGDGNLYEWKDQLGRTLASVVPHLPGDETLRRLLRPILEQPDEIAMRLLAPFTVSLVCSEVLDALEIRDDTLHLLQVVLERTLESDDLRRSRYNDGRIGGFDLPNLIKSLLFVIVEHASGAARFANGNWDDVSRVMPLIDRMGVPLAGTPTSCASSLRYVSVLVLPTRSTHSLTKCWSRSLMAACLRAGRVARYQPRLLLLYRRMLIACIRCLSLWPVSCFKCLMRWSTLAIAAAQLCSKASHFAVCVSLRQYESIHGGRELSRIALLRVRLITYL